VFRVEKYGYVETLRRSQRWLGAPRENPRLSPARSLEVLDLFFSFKRHDSTEANAFALYSSSSIRKLESHFMPSYQPAPSRRSHAARNSALALPIGGAP
jgi:hypothetical protein